MKRSLTVSALILLTAACSDTIVAPFPARDPGPPAANGMAPVRLGDAPSDPLLDGTSTGSVVIDFESLAGSGVTQSVMSSYSEDGFTLVDPANSGDAFLAPLEGHAMYQGSIALLNLVSGDVTVLTKDDGGTFTAVSIDIAELQSSDLRPRDVSFTGTRADGSTVTATFTTDGVAGFETFTFDGFTDLISLSWVQAAPYHQFDNITLDPAAAPADPSLDPASKDECRNGGWEGMGFRNQGQCIRMVETGKDSR